MAGGQITDVERIERLTQIKRLKEEGLSNSKIAQEMDIPIATIQRNVKTLEKLSISDLSIEDISQKRSELELEFNHIIELAKKEFDTNKIEKPSIARSYLLLAKEAIADKMKLYGFDNVKVESFTQNNTQNNYDVPDKIDMKTGEKIAEAIKKSHEAKL